MLVNLSRNISKLRLTNAALITRPKEFHQSSPLASSSQTGQGQTTEPTPNDESTKNNSTNNINVDAQQQQQQQLKTLEEKLSKCENDLINYKDRLLRALADAENTRNRMRKQVDDAKVFGIQNFSKDLLEVADVLNLAIKNTDPSVDEKKTASDAKELTEQLNAMFRGLVLTESCLLKVFAKHGLVQIMPKEGDKFDPNLHEAIFRVPAPDKISGTVHTLTKIGFRLNERTLRAAQVGVVQ